jgi:hypothetical protein
MTEGRRAWIAVVGKSTEDGGFEDRSTCHCCHCAAGRNTSIGREHSSTNRNVLIVKIESSKAARKFGAREERGCL